MAQHDYDINSSDSISGLQFRQDVNAVLSAIKSSNSGATAPTAYIAGTLWLDTSTTPHILKKRNTANTGWDTIRIEDALGAPIASGTTTTVGTYSGGNTIHITGTTTITSLGVSTTGTTRTLIFDSALTITHNATSLICPNGLSITTVAGDAITVICEDGALGYWRISSISRLMTSELSDDIKQNLFESKPSGDNIIINSNGLVNQRGYASGTATTVSNQYTLDMFRVVTSGQNLTFSTTAGVTTFTAPAGGVDLPIENKNIIGGSYVLSFTGTATAVVAQSVDNITYTTVTPVAGVYTITGGYYVRVRYSGGTFSKPKFEEGTIHTPYSLPDFGLELQDCQRYLPVVSGHAAGFCASTSEVWVAYNLSAEAYAVPSGILTSVSGIIYHGNKLTNTVTAIVFNGGSKLSVLIQATGTGTPFTVGQGCTASLPDILLLGCGL